MCEAVIDKKIEYATHRRRTYEAEVEFWKPSDTEEALQVFDFQDLLAASGQYWDMLCRIRDALCEHESKCVKDHSAHFVKISNWMQDFLDDAKIIEAMLEKLESSYHEEIENASRFRQAKREATILLATQVSRLAAKATPIRDWGD